MTPEARMELKRSKILRESKERDRQFTNHDRGFAWGFVLGIWAAGLVLFLWFAHSK